jgi:hypothetical protein
MEEDGFSEMESAEENLVIEGSMKKQDEVKALKVVKPKVEAIKIEPIKAKVAEPKVEPPKKIVEPPKVEPTKIVPKVEPKVEVKPKIEAQPSIEKFDSQAFTINDKVPEGQYNQDEFEDEI